MFFLSGLETETNSSKSDILKFSPNQSLSQNLQQKTCLWCRKPFKPKIKKQRFCSRLCVDRYRNFEDRIRMTCFGDSEKTSNCLKILENQGIYACFPLKKLDLLIETERRDSWIYKRLQA